MITRIVKMTFNPTRVPEFLVLFEKNKKHIASFEGCKHLELLNDIDYTNIFFTYSIWHDEKYLEDYRTSNLFNTVWSETKILFEAKPEVWTVRTVDSKK